MSPLSSRTSASIPGRLYFGFESAAEVIFVESRTEEEKFAGVVTVGEGEFEREAGGVRGRPRPRWRDSERMSELVFAEGDEERDGGRTQGALQEGQRPSAAGA